eukprot:TRINITY_DN87568_c0_g2_i1.p1 TRINITY_DN87568_c0_g2~~TRINITY_DN87568_c0_g2_i1.p1  ORF type:complete len:154 (-),score=37.75 TRINITY_DN87568_c0_g2_i1:77-538(-)
MSQLGYDLLRESTPKYYQPSVDRAAPVSLLNRIAIVAIERFILMMNNTLLLTRHHRLANIYQVVDYLLGNHDDCVVGDRGDFYRRKLAEQIYLNFGVHYVTHQNVLNLVRDTIQLEADTRHVLSRCGVQRSTAPPIPVDDQVLDVLARIADMH